MACIRTHRLFCDATASKNRWEAICTTRYCSQAVHNPRSHFLPHRYTARSLSDVRGIFFGNVSHCTRGTRLVRMGLPTDGLPGILVSANRSVLCQYDWTRRANSKVIATIDHGWQIYCLSCLLPFPCPYFFKLFRRDRYACKLDAIVAAEASHGIPCDGGSDGGIDVQFPLL